jgi:Malectin domain/Kelch motif/Cep192 domain 4
VVIKRTVARLPIIAIVLMAVGVLPSPANAASTVVYRVNAGGPQLQGTPAWSADTQASPSPYVNALDTGNMTFSTAHTIDMSDPSIPPDMPTALFQTERWDSSSAPEMHWHFPVTAGPYQVRLAFAEIYEGTQSVGARVFDVLIEGATVLDNYDVFANVGGYKGVIKSFTVSSDASLDITFGHVVQNPAVKGIEIVSAGGPNQLGTSPTSLDFGTVTVGATSSKSLQLTNLGGTGDPSIVIDQTTITGTDALQFADTFDDAANVTLAPGASTTISVNFTPASAGAKSATLQIAHSGSNSPLAVPLTGTGSSLAGAWESRAPSGPARQEVSYVQVGSKFYLAGGSTTQEVYDPATNAWSTVAPLPQQLDHIQGVEVAGLIYYVGGLQQWPGPNVDTVYIYNPATDTFKQGAPMPRGRGAGGVAVYNGKIYYAGGLNNSMAVPWFDVYDPAANTWTQLPDMPTARDHFHAAVVNGKFYAIGGRNVQIDAMTTVNQAFDFTTGNWTLGLAALPTARGGFAAAALGDEVLIIGGEGNNQTYHTVEAYNTVTNTWRKLADMPTARHGIQAAVCNGGVYIAAGGLVQGGGSPTDVHEVFFLNGAKPCTSSATPVGFGKSTLGGATAQRVTSVQFGPDGRLYAAQQDGLINAYTIKRNGPNSYAVTATEKITAIRAIPNHNDNGAVNTSITDRQVTGILVTGTATSPVLYVTSSDPRIGGGSTGSDTNLDTNSGIISRLTWNGTSWQRQDLVRGLPRSEENHSPNGIQLDSVSNTLYVAVGGLTNMGAPSNNFALLPEYALSAAILKVDLSAIGSGTYDLPTLDDETRAGTTDAGDPFGGDNAKNQAKLVANGPVQVHAAGFRNPYDLLITKSGRMYTIDNGANAGWGDVPKQEGPGGTCTNAVNEPGVTDSDSLHFVTGTGYFGGHPNPTRGNKANTFNVSNPQSPVSTANPVECDYRTPGSENGALTTFGSSTNGLAEYTASNFGGVLKGDLLAASYDNKLYRMKLNSTGAAVTLKDALFSTVGSTPLDVTALGDGGPFPGTIWVGDIANGSITIFEPNDFSAGTPTCTGTDSATLDEDGDGYSNADELDNGTDPCSAGDLPPDADHDFISNLNDADDDNDGLPDTSDPFAVDPNNGMTTTLPVRYTWDNNAPSAGGILGLGFTGLMSNGSANYESLFNLADMTGGGAAGVVTVDKVADGDALGSTNTQQYGLQFGVKPPSSGSFTVHTRIAAPFAGLTPQDDQSMGLFLGTGDQDNYVKVVTFANGGAGGVQARKEVGGVAATPSSSNVTLPGPDGVDLYLIVDAAAATVQPSYAVINNGVSGPVTNVGAPLAIPSAWLSGTSTGLAVGIISTSAGPAPEFPATWDLIEVTSEGGTSVASDTFTRTLTGAWGTADVGGAWSVLAGSASNFAVNGSKGTIVTPTKSVQQLAHLGTASVRDVDYRVEISISTAVAKGSKGLFSSLVLRHQASGADYRVGLYLTGTGKVFIRGQTNTGTNIFADADTGLTFTAGDTFVLRVQAEGVNPTTIRAKAWKAGAAEPSAWMVTASDTTAALQTAGTLGIRTLNSTSAVTTLSFDNLRADRISGA